MQTIHYIIRWKDEPKEYLEIYTTHTELKTKIRQMLKLSPQEIIVTRVIHDQTSVTRSDYDLLDEQWPNEEKENEEKYTRNCSDTWPFVKRRV